MDKAVKMVPFKGMFPQSLLQQIGILLRGPCDGTGSVLP